MSKQRLINSIRTAEETICNLQHALENAQAKLHSLPISTDSLDKSSHAETLMNILVIFHDNAEALALLNEIPVDNTMKLQLEQFMVIHQKTRATLEINIAHSLQKQAELTQENQRIQEDTKKILDLVRAQGEQYTEKYINFVLQQAWNRCEPAIGQELDAIGMLRKLMDNNTKEIQLLKNSYEATCTAKSLTEKALTACHIQLAAMAIKMTYSSNTLFTNDFIHEQILSLNTEIACQNLAKQLQEGIERINNEIRDVLQFKALQMQALAQFSSEEEKASSAGKAKRSSLTTLSILAQPHSRADKARASIDRTDRATGLSPANPFHTS